MALIVYNPEDNAHVAVIIQWWSALPERDREVTFHPNLHKLAAFLAWFNERRANLLFALDQQGLTLGAWTEALWDGAQFGVWVRPDKRSAPGVWRDLQQAYRMALEVYPVLFGYTRQPKLHAAHLKLGYEYAGKLPQAWGGQPVWIYALTREGWARRAVAAAEVRARKQSLRPTAASNGKVQVELPASAAIEELDRRGIEFAEHADPEQQP